MALRVELLEPGEAIPRGRGYVGVTDANPNAELVFPHVDSCLALALILKTGRLIGGHVPQQWHNAPEKNYSGCIAKILNLMEANRARVGGEPDLLIVAGHGNWWHGDLGAEAGTAMARWGADFFGITTDDNAPKGVNIYVKPNSLTIERVHDHNRRVWNNLAGMRGTYKTSAF